MPDYASLIDAETWAFIEETARHYPPDAVNLSIADQRAVYDRMCRAFFAGYPDGVTAADSDHGTWRARTYAPPADPAFTTVYFHGGGFVVGGLDSHDDVCAELCARCGCRVVSVDYRLSPEHRHPAPHDDARAATEWVLATTTGPVVLAGDSAGGNLAATVAHALRGTTDRIVGQVLIYPGLGGDMSKGSYVEHAEAPMLTRADIAFYMGIRYEGGVRPSGDVTDAPLSDTDFGGLPPTVAISAGCDPLRDDCPDYVNAVRAAGGRAHWIDEPGLVHGYLRARTTVGRARASFDRIVAAVSALGAGQWPYG